MCSSLLGRLARREEEVDTYEYMSYMVWPGYSIRIGRELLVPGVERMRNVITLGLSTRTEWQSS